MKMILSRAEIYRRFKSEWVLIADPVSDEESLELKRGRVLCHSKDRDEVYRKAFKLRPKRAALLYTGTIPEGTAVIL